MLIILDRDGVINLDSPDYIKSPQEWHAIEGSLTAIAKLNNAGFTVVIATNQSGVGRGYYDAETLRAIHQKMQDELYSLGGHIDKIYYCPHTPEDNCSCRKPKPGMLYQIQQDFPMLFPEAIFVGDSWRDIQAAQAVCCKAVLVKTGNGKKTLSMHPKLTCIPVYKNLTEFVNTLLRKKMAD